MAETAEKTRLRELFESLDQRRRPEDVAILVEKELGLSGRTIAGITRHAKQNKYGWSSMSDDFQRPKGMDRQLGVAAHLFSIETPSLANLMEIDEFIQQAESKLKIVAGCTDFKHDRLNRETRRANGIEVSKRQYNKMFRLAARMESKRIKYGTELEKREFQQVSKSRLAAKVKWEDMQDSNTACFIAYYTAKCNKRSTFTNESQERPYDKLCDDLFQRCLGSATTNWWAIAHVYPDEKVLRHLTDEQKGQLLGRWYDVLYRLSNLLKGTWERSNINRRTMIVKKGNDSSTWNVMAGAWNKARDSWVSLLYALEMEGLLDNLCLGKVLRLMAADVAYWHRATGGELEPDTAVWCEVPLPWEVLIGNARCTREQVEEICARHGVDANKKGWTSPKKGGIVHEFNPTPELVHGVQVGHPLFAKFLKGIGAFSGKARNETA